VADLDQQLVIANLNVDRLTLQGAVNTDEKVATGNIYLEQAVAERDALQHERELVVQSLSERVALRTLVSGRVLAAPARSAMWWRQGRPCSSWPILRGCAWLPSVSMANSASGFVRPRQGSMDDQGEAGLSRRGAAGRAPGWRLLFDLADATALSPGQLVEVRAETFADRLVSLPADACAVEADGTTVVWVHRSPERFAPLRLKSCAAGVGAQLAQGDRLVTQGGGLLSQYR